MYITSKMADKIELLEDGPAARYIKALTRSQEEKRKKQERWAVAIFAAIILGIVLPMAIRLFQPKTCQRLDIGIETNLQYPYGKDVQFISNIDLERAQPNVVYYLVRPALFNIQCSGRDWRTDPYGLDSMIYDDYSGLPYLPVGLAPLAEFGTEACLVPNTVPMHPALISGEWRVLDEMLHANYTGKLVYKGCDYKDNLMRSWSGKFIDIPIGCYYAVLNTEDIFAKSAPLLDYGYYANEVGAQCEKKLPTWLQC